eukprot:m.136033 g.136033  ORF g.136033 m.136033 type:complete len:942 (+) comp23938_c0_seq1:3290-6115(+)
MMKKFQILAMTGKIPWRPRLIHLLSHRPRSLRHQPQPQAFLQLFWHDETRQLPSRKKLFSAGSVASIFSDSAMSTSSFSMRYGKRPSSSQLHKFAALEEIQRKVASATEDSDDSAVLRLLEPGDEIKLREPASRVLGLDAFEGVFFLCESNNYFLQGYRLRNGTLHRIEDQSGGHLNIIKWALEELKDVLKRRYCLQERALELFSMDGTNSLLVFENRTKRDNVYNMVVAGATMLAEKAVDSVAGMQRNAKVERDGIFSSLLGAKSVTQRWQAGELTNFQYLMYLNTLAGRSYNDLNQYPVFPWILRDYHSEELDLSDPDVYRDLRKPMGAQTPNRAEGFKLRYDTWEDPTDEGTPPFHYGTHYSSAAIVASYLIRLEPFTQHFLKLQGGHFDHPDRMFHSISEAWLSASEKNNGDVKELIPEFFYLPDFLLNSNHFNLGEKQNGEVLGDVLLPPWAKGDPHEFIRLHREALESDYVGAHLHEWIDLTFGYKQQGDEAKNSLNVFHHLTYEGAVDIDAIADPVRRQATVSIINNFGQTPRQLFKRPHPARRVRNVWSLQLLSPKNPLDRLMCTAHPLKEISSPVGQIIATDKLHVVGHKQLLLPPMYTRCVAWDRPDNTVCGFTLDSEKDVAVYEGLHIGAVTAMLLPSPRFAITGGEDTTVRVWQIQSRKQKRQLTLVRTLCGHLGPITCISLSSTYNFIVSGSEDRTCIVWDLTRMRYLRQLRMHTSTITAIAINDATGDIITCDRDVVYWWTINGHLLCKSDAFRSPNSPILSCALTAPSEWANDSMVITGHRDGRVKLWTTSFTRDKETNEWKRTLVQARCLPANTTIPETCAVSTVYVTPDNKRLYVGDVMGHVFSWSLPDGAGKTVEHWVKDQAVVTCMGEKCNVKFSFSERRHHCRNCGKVFCFRCSSKEAAIPRLNISKSVRVCDVCYQTLSS